ncbi:MAG: hypothetical protein M5U34_39800 [Chloroflexi bacterium]|nr:hypothetical protein [Chloroflexota bacterium]
MPLPEDRMVHSREFLEDQITMALGGRASEEIFFGRITTGASNDLQQATRMARAMVMQYGMSDSLGLSTYGDQRSNPFLGGDWGLSSRNYSEEAAKRIDKEVRNILHRSYDRALDIIKQNRDVLVSLAEKLLDVETLDREAFEALMNKRPSDDLTPSPTG